MEHNNRLPMERLKESLPVENVIQQQGKNTEHEPLVAQFREFLQQQDTQVLINSQANDQANSQDKEQPPVTLFNLFTELAALKNEVKRESMQVKDAVGTFSGLLDTLKNTNQQLSTELEQRKQQQKQTVFAYQLPVFEEIFDLYESVDRARESLANYQPSWWEKNSKKGSAFREQTIEGLEITLRRLEKTLDRYGVEAILCVGVSLNPRTMKAVKVAEDEKQANGMVLEEIRKGYIRYGEVLRLVEVVVNRIEK